MKNVNKKIIGVGNFAEMRGDRSSMECCGIRQRDFAYRVRKLV